jgi:hypothetical protein
MLRCKTSSLFILIFFRLFEIISEVSSHVPIRFSNAGLTLQLSRAGILPPQLTQENDIRIRLYFFCAAGNFFVVKFCLQLDFHETQRSNF